MPNWNNSEQIRLLNGHYIRLPANFGARVYRSTNESHASSGAWQYVTFDTTRWDTGITNETVGGLDFSNGIWYADYGGVGAGATKLYATWAGWYDIWGCISFAASAAGDLRQAGIRLNGSNLISIDDDHDPAASEPCTIDVSTKWRMGKGDYVELGGWQDSGGALNMLRAADYSIEFAMVRIP